MLPYLCGFPLFISFHRACLFFNYTHSGFDIQEEEAWCLKEWSFLCHHHQTPPSHYCPSPPLLDLLKEAHKKQVYIRLWVWNPRDFVSAEFVGVCPAHLDGRIRGKDSVSAHSSTHTPESLQSGWPRSGGERLTPGKKTNKKKTTSRSGKKARHSPGFHTSPKVQRWMWTETYSFLKKLFQRVNPGTIPSFSINDNTKSKHKQEEEFMTKVIILITIK